MTSLLSTPLDSIKVRTHRNGQFNPVVLNNGGCRFSIRCQSFYHQSFKHCAQLLVLFFKTAAKYCDTGKEVKNKGIIQHSGMFLTDGGRVETSVSYEAALRLRNPIITTTIIEVSQFTARLHVSYSVLA